MDKTTIGFIGSGRVTAFIIEGLSAKRQDLIISVMDSNPAASSSLARTFPGISDAGTDYKAVGGTDIIFLALHPQHVQAGCEAVAPFIGKDTIVVSLAPKAKLSALSAWLGTDRVARYLPNAATSVGEGYNPVVWGNGISAQERKKTEGIFSTLGEHPEVDEGKIEAYAVLCAMGPTYLWPLLDEMIASGIRYGLGESESIQLVSRMAASCASMIEHSGKDYATRMNMIPSKPMADIEQNLRGMFRDKLDAIHGKLKG